MFCVNEETNWRELYEASEIKIKIFEDFNIKMQTEIKKLESENIDLSVSLYNAQEQNKRFQEQITRLETRNKLIEAQNLCFWRELVEQKTLNKITMKEVIHARTELQENLPIVEDSLLLKKEIFPKKTNLSFDLVENQPLKKKHRKT